MENNNNQQKIIDNGRLDRVEHHLKLMKDSLDKINMDIHKISSSLIGNEYTGHVGIVSSLNDIHKQVLQNKDDIEMLKENFALIKWIGSAIGGFVITIIIYIIQKNI